MTVHGANLPTPSLGAAPAPGSGELRAPQPPSQIDLQTAEAARQFEQLIVQQLFEIMRESTSGGMFGDGPGAQMYGHMLDTAMAEQMTAGQGIGMRDMLQRSMGGNPQAAVDSVGVLGTQHMSSFTPDMVNGPLPLGGTRNDGARPFQSVAMEMINRNSALRWAREGQLLPEDMNSEFSTIEEGGIANFNVRDAGGFQDQYKCNLFAFEFVRRAGYQVPLMGRYRGWGYPEPNTITADAQDNQLRGNWGRVASGHPADAYNSTIERGEAAYMLSGSGAEGRSGHMGVIERIHSIDYDEAGNIDRIVFDGWEARPTGARHLVERTWNRRGNWGGNDPRNGFVDIEIIQLRMPETGERPETPTSHRAGASVYDNSNSSSGENRPNHRSEENR